jgi:large subunit ribosomal protein L10e
LLVFGAIISSGIAMTRLRPGKTCRSIHSQAWSRYSLKKPKKNYVRAMPHTSLLIFNMGVRKDSYDLELTLNSEQGVQLRSNAIESARQMANKYLEATIPENYMLKVLIYPHNVIREHKMSTAAGADRTSRGMSQSFGKPVSVAARVKENQPIFLLNTMKGNRTPAVTALKKAAAKLSGKYKVRAA